MKQKKSDDFHKKTNFWILERWHCSCILSWNTKPEFNYFHSFFRNFQILSAFLLERIKFLVRSKLENDENLDKSCSKRTATPSQTRKQVFWKHFKCPDRAISNRFFLEKYQDLVSFPTPKTPFGVFKEFVQRGGIWTLK